MAVVNLSSFPSALLPAVLSARAVDNARTSLRVMQTQRRDAEEATRAMAMARHPSSQRADVR